MVPAWAAEPPATTITSPTNLIVATPFTQDTPLTRRGPIHGWNAGIGQWRVQEGALHGDELAEDHHASSCTYRLDAKDMVITAKVKLGDAVHVAIGCRDTVPTHHHLGRTFISRDGIWIQKMSGIAKSTKAEKLAQVDSPMDPNAWYDVTIEISGDHYRAVVGEHVVEAHHSRFQDAKGIVALIVKGQGAQFKNVTLWHAEPTSASR